MKQIILGILVLAFAACSQKPLEEGKYRISGEVVGMEEGNIYRYTGQGIDTIKVVKGKFQFEDEIEGPVKNLYILKDAEDRAAANSINLLVEPGLMNLTIDNSDWSNSKLTGSTAQDEAYKMEAIVEQISAKYQSDIDASDEINAKYREAKSAGASEDELEALKAESNKLREKLEPLYEEYRQAQLSFVKDNPQAFVSLQHMRFLIQNMDYSEASEIYANMADTYKTTELAKEIEREIENMKLGIPGAEAGDFNTTDINGNPIKLADFKGKYLLIDFWASWCAPCRAGNPHLIEVYNKYNDKGLEILGVSDDDSNPEAWKKAVEKDQIGIWHHVLRGFEYNRETREMNRENDISEGYNIHTLPTKILVGPDGIIVGRFGGGGGTDEDMDKMLDEIFNN
ncbi:TlpA disulfide reductase family protein [Sunxiuqinia indica]|uniref:TlpA disulfide reductase family protein n=1 Tax=Sunxiuqinia indica TaxID=2692584 RepID=UPI0013582E29|nr:TlpA disulfide reductase family protein [Sunxiuqinia indica]